MASASNGGTPLPEEVSKPPEGVVLPPKDIRGKFVHASEACDGRKLTLKQLSSRKRLAMSLETVSSSKVRHILDMLIYYSNRAAHAQTLRSRS